MRLFVVTALIATANWQQVSAAPVSHALSDLNVHHQEARSFLDALDHAVSWLCDLPKVDRICQKTYSIIEDWQARSTGAKTVTLPLGRVAGFKGSNTYRYTIPYAKPPTESLRFQPPAALSSWTSVYNATSLPPACPQSLLLSSAPSTTEDCLYMNIWVPTTATPLSKFPVFVWLHGGSYVAGSSSDQALDGNILASKGNMIVITLQYRLGMLGFLRAPEVGIAGNMAVQDAVQALSYIQSSISSFGGDAQRVTLAGQSSGADLIKTLFTVPQADTLFQRAILHSAPLNYGDHSTTTSEAVSQLFLQSLQCSTLSCLQSANVSSIISAQDNTFLSASYAIAGVSASEPIRPVVDGTLVTQSFLKAVNGNGLNNKNRQIIFTTVKDEAGPTIASVSQGQVIPHEYYSAYIQALMDSDRAGKVLNSGLYVPDASNSDDARIELNKLGTDWVWTCANQQAAVNITRHGGDGKIWLAEFDAGIPYPSNQGIAFCKGRICHQDDIEAVFSTGENLSNAQTALENEILARWSSFAATGQPNSPQYPPWPAIKAMALSDTDVKLNMLVLSGASSKVVQMQRQDQCGPNGFWGRVAKFDEQLFSA